VAEVVCATVRFVSNLADEWANLFGAWQRS